MMHTRTRRHTSPARLLEGAGQQAAVADPQSAGSHRFDRIPIARDSVARVNAETETVRRDDDERAEIPDAGMEMTPLIASAESTTPTAPDPQIPAPPGAVANAPDAVYEQSAPHDGILGTAGRFASGMWSGVTDTVKGIGTLVTHPGAVLHNLQEQGLSGIAKGVIEPYKERVARGDYAGAIGRGVFDVGSMLLPGVGEAGKVGEGAGAVARIGEAGELAAHAGEGAELAAHAGEGAKAIAQAGEEANLAAHAGEGAKAMTQAGEDATLAAHDGEALTKATDQTGNALAETAHDTGGHGADLFDDTPASVPVGRSQPWRSHVSADAADANLTPRNPGMPIEVLPKDVPLDVVDGDIVAPKGLPANRPGTVNGIPYSGHAFDRMQGRGLVPSVVENALKTGVEFPGGAPGVVLHYDPVNNISVVSDVNTRNIITVRPGPPGK
jgi:hypothetical protein